MLTENQFHFQFVTSFKLLSQSPAKGVVLEGGEAGVETGGAGNPVRIRVFKEFLTANGRKLTPIKYLKFALIGVH
jgi:hypothetical protein